MLGLSNTVIPGQNPYSVECCKIGGVFQEIKAYSFVTWWSFWLISSRFDVYCGCRYFCSSHCNLICQGTLQENLLFHSSFAGYLVGLLVTILIMNWFQTAADLRFNFHPFWRMVSSFIALNLFRQLLEFDEAADNSSEGMEVEYEVQKQEIWLRRLRCLLTLSER